MTKDSKDAPKVKIIKPLRKAKASTKKTTTKKPKAKTTTAKQTKTNKRRKPDSGTALRSTFLTEKYRFYLMWMGCLALFALLVYRALDIQVLNNDIYQQKAAKYTISTRTQPVNRGVILDRNRTPLAISTPLVTVFFSPHDYARDYYQQLKLLQQAKDTERYKRVKKNTDDVFARMDLKVLADYTGIPIEQFQAAVDIDNLINLSDPKKANKIIDAKLKDMSHYLPLLDKASPQTAQVLIDLNFPAVHTNNLYRRFYPQPQPNAQLLGFMGESENSLPKGYAGRAGIEKLYETALAGKSGKVKVTKNANQNSIKELEQITPIVPSQDIVLSIDSRLQYLLYRELENAGRVQSAQFASGMIVDVQTGEVLAMSNWPSYNPNNMLEMNAVNQRNRAIIDSFEPGSVMKPFTVAAALESNKYHRNSVIDTSPGSLRVKGYVIRDHGNYGVISLDTLIKKSSNVASAKIALNLPADAIANMQRQFGFGKKTAIQFPAEDSGALTTPTAKQTARRASMSYGYGMTATLAQLCQAYAALANQGKFKPITLLKQDGLDKAQHTAEQVIRAENAAAIVSMMETVTERGGTATAAAIEGYRVAGKTGTTRRYKPTGGYYKDKYRTVFVGLAPVSNPRFVVGIVVEDPSIDHYAGLVAAPVFRDVMQETLRLYNVPFDKPLAEG